MLAKFFAVVLAFLAIIIEISIRYLVKESNYEDSGVIFDITWFYNNRHTLSFDVTVCFLIARLMVIGDRSEGMKFSKPVNPFN